MRKRSSDASICSSIFGTGSPSAAAARGRSRRGSRPRRLLAPSNRLDRLAEAVHLRARVVVVVLALDVVAGEREEPRDRVAVRAVPRRRDGDRAGRVRRDSLDLEALAQRGPAGAVVATAARISASASRYHSRATQSSRTPAPRPPRALRAGSRQHRRAPGRDRAATAAAAGRVEARRWSRSRRARRRGRSSSTGDPAASSTSAARRVTAFVGDMGCIVGAQWTTRHRSGI